MKKYFGRLLCLALIIFTFIAGAVNTFAMSAPEELVTKDGINYVLSNDKTYYEVAGPAFDLNSLTILPDIDGVPVTAIKETAFKNNQYINKVVIPYGITKIGDAAFRNCANLTEIVIPKSVNYLPAECFYECGMLNKITLPSGLIGIGDDCFKNCTMLGELKIPASVTEIGHDSFLNCEQLLLDVSDNPYAADYAKKENLNTDFKNSSAYFLMVVGICAIIAVIIIVIISIPLKKHIKKHPNHDPVIYIEKFFSAIGRFLTFIYEMIKKGVLFIAGKIIVFVEILGKKLRKKRAQRKENNPKNEKVKADEENN